ncbi:DUF1360 domain-containing protein [Kribbella sp. NPDC051936]|uniref:DUF1360 domain-containing protein n=1 Tax=Kribbella sp. NPDC051936 TaxID=3154946 RepID=UPI00343B842E
MRKLAESVRETADEYRQGANRPLGGYVVAMTVFAGLAGLAGLAGAVAALRGTSSRRISPYDLILMTAGTHKLARLISKDSITSPLRMPFTRIAASALTAVAGADYLQLIYAKLQQSAED